MSTPSATSRRLAVVAAAAAAACLAALAVTARPVHAELGPADPPPTVAPAPSPGHQDGGAVGTAGDTSSVPAPSGVDTGATVLTARAPQGRLAVGDSLLVGAAPLLRRAGFDIHARVGRQFSSAPAIVRSYGRSLPRNLVIELGTNGTVSLATCRRVVRTAGPERRVFLVTNRVPRRWQEPNNATLRACDRSFAARRVRIIDWHGASSGRPAWFAGDGVHPSASGRRAFARLIDRAVDRHGR